ncbi:hypothetical protein [Streptomyces cacaoi]|uniref:hypothetical protein n=1 Tax=Streptomyces cacaoi TaxID=1898 RepID=UPI0011F1984F|nr:hypothetical protein [Streptomyces cacaoi]
MRETGIIWWGKARRLWALVPALAAFTALVTLSHAGASVPLLSFPAAGTVPVPLLLFTPVPVVATLVWCLDNRLPEAEASAVRSTAVADTALAVAVCAVASGVGTAVALLSGSTAAVATGRDTAFLAGIVLCLRPPAGQAAVLAAPAWLVVVVFFGLPSAGPPPVWTVVGHSAAAPLPLTATLLAFVAGLSVLARSSRTSV